MSEALNPKAIVRDSVNFHLGREVEVTDEQTISGVTVCWVVYDKNIGFAVRKENLEFI